MLGIIQLGASIRLCDGVLNVGVIIAKGMILDGDQPAGTIGGDSLSDLIRQAREDEKIKSLVLRIDTGGGSSFASEVVRREIELTRKSGKPVIVSMGSVAASGGYWIASAADEIWASPTTITGSIGIFGAFVTFENSLDSLGIHSDGVGTTNLADAFDPSRPLNPLIKDAWQQMIEHGYIRFIERVAEGRAMPPEDVEKIAQGRVWSGATAVKIGLRIVSIDLFNTPLDSNLAFQVRPEKQHCGLRVFGQAHQHMGVVAEECPARVRFAHNIPD